MNKKFCQSQRTYHPTKRLSSERISQALQFLMVSQYLSFHTLDLRKVPKSLSILSYPRCPLLPFQYNWRTCFPASHPSSQITTGPRNNEKCCRTSCCVLKLHRYSLPHMKGLKAQSLGPIYQETCFRVMFVFHQVNQATDIQMQVKLCTKWPFVYSAGHAFLCCQLWCMFWHL